jgi:tRNA A37 threonylcarbamoyladenosine modification protein TsaB
MKLVIQLGYNQISLAAGQVVCEIKLDSVAALSEVFLIRLDRFIKKLGQQGIVIDGLAVSQTAPSFSGLRTILIFANLFARQHSWPLIDLVTGKKIRLALPQYNQEPNITQSKKHLIK